MTADRLFDKLRNFNNLSSDEQGELTVALARVVDIVACGVWSQHDLGFCSYSQCSFCYVGPHSKHDDDCPVTLAKKVRDEL